MTFILATFDPNTWDYIFKLRETQGIKSVSRMNDKCGISIKLEDNIEIVEIRRREGKIMEYEIVVNYAKRENRLYAVTTKGLRSYGTSYRNGRTYNVCRTLQR